MLKKILSLMLSVTMVLSLFAAMPITAFADNPTVWDGSSTEDYSLLDSGQANSADNPYIIDTAAKLAKLALEVKNGTTYAGMYFKQTVDLDLDYRPWTPIGWVGSSYDTNKPFQGFYDGQGKKISKLSISDGRSWAGLFAFVGESAIIDSIVLDDVNITGNNLTGGLAGENKGTIRNCKVDGNVSGGFALGGLVGQSTNGLLENCHSSAKVIGNYEYTGGLVGYSFRSANDSALSISQCSASGDVEGLKRTGGLIGSLQGGTCRESFSSGKVTGQVVGGFVGVIEGGNDYINRVQDCYSVGEVVLISGSQQYIGGFAGANWWGIIERCYAAGALTTLEVSDAGGLIGQIYAGTQTTDSYYDSEITGLSDIGKGTPKTTLELKEMTTFNNWDFPATWTISDDNNGYPALTWQGYDHGSLQTVTDLVIEDAIAPINGGAPKTTITETEQYTGTISWIGNPATFALNTEYVATITLSAKDGYTFEGVAEDAFTVSAAAKINTENAENSGVITATFWSPPNGYITDGNGMMAFSYNESYSYGPDIQGTYNGAWQQTTCGNAGYGTSFRFGDEDPVALSISSASPVDVGRGITIGFEPKFYSSGRFLRIVYTLHNSGSETQTVSFGSHADTQIGNDDGATITKLDDGRGFKMVNRNYPAQFNFFGKETIGVTDVDTYWFGYYYDRYNNVFNQIGDPSFSGDSGMAYSWKDKTLAPGQTRTFSVLIGIGDALSGENVPIGVNFDSQGGSDVDTIIVEMAGDTINAPTSPTRSGYTFGGWYTEQECTNQFNFATPITATITLYAKWTQNTPPPSGGGSYTPPKYPVTDANQGVQVGGQTKLSKERAEAGDTVMITVTPDIGYENGVPTIRDKSGNLVAVTDNGDGTFSFKMPSGEVTVDTKFTKIDYFDDVSGADWFDEASWYCAAHGLIQGTGHRQFDGNVGTNRAMLVTVLYRLANSTDDLESIFDDVESGKWYSEAIGWAAHNKIVAGYGNGKFGPDDTLTREQMVAVLYRYSMFMKYDVSKLNDLNTFTDADTVSEWALNAMKWAAGNGIVEGIGNDLISPETGATRAQFAAMMQRFCTGFVK